MESRVDLEEPRYDRLVFPDTVPRVEMVARRNLRTRGESSCVREDLRWRVDLRQFCRTRGRNGAISIWIFMGCGKMKFSFVKGMG